MSSKKVAFSFGVILSVFFFNPAQAIRPDFYNGWDSQLAKYVDGSGFVDYRGWKDDHDGLDSFLAAAGKVTAQEYSKMPKEERLAFWINLYNAFTVKQILDHYPIKRSGINFYPDNSIRQIDGVWDKYRLSAAGKRVSLSDIENKILREELKEPRIHFAINCASKSCPRLLNRAYTSGNAIYKDLDAVAFTFVNDKTRNRFSVPDRKIEISRIFDWFGDDFKNDNGARPLRGRKAKESAVLAFLKKFVQGPEREMVSAENTSLSYLPYDWSLNEQVRR